MVFFQTYKASEIQKNILREIQILHMKWNENETMPPPFITCLANTEQNIYFYPKGHVEVLQDINSEGIVAHVASITGPKDTPVGLRFGKDYLMIKLAFQPTGLYRMLKKPMQTFVNIGLNANDFFTNEIELVTKKLGLAVSYEAMIKIVSDFMDNQIQKGIIPEEPIDLVAIKMLDPFARYSIPEWASMACLSIRQFERNFTTRVGISPKMYTRIVRFENAMKVKNNSPEKSWSDIALECEYDDSSHLLREFRQFADFPPGTLLKKQTSGYGDFPTG